ncbi:RnfABCDGE type electron transport complex subunit G [Winogradskyella alexanderae]|uniref:Ion-translocating oxidoreductase complex subunit G n=1 Tax=Winogradskyella alexanderae TaxID=2877123 RepID=A0ABS7XPZ3_9FLAO|nr:RnfABCDGE type electron transport complex subunit G [Winogradskyella alexanderae]MCA0131564.1 RnfABCDGE type electron transport complex subunit G [Winogradskyella alexanderae]
MVKKKSTFATMVISLVMITLVSGFVLGYVNDITQEPKAKARLEKKINAIKQVLPEFDNNPIEDVIKIPSSKFNDSIEIYPAYKNNEFIGAALSGYSNKGYNGLIKIMAGFKPDGSIQNIEVIEQKETPGLGTKLKNNSFLKQFRGQNPSVFNLDVSKDGGDVDAIAGATISTRAFNESLKMAYDEFMAYLTKYTPN